MVNSRGCGWWAKQDQVKAGATLVARGACLTTTLVLVSALGGCGGSEVEPQPGLRIDGPPDVLAVLAASNRPLPSPVLLEEATYCRPNDAKRPSRIFLPGSAETEVCPVDITKSVDIFRGASPAYWYARIVFDERLDLDTPTEPDGDPGKMQVAGLGEFCCSSKPIRASDGVASAAGP